MNNFLLSITHVLHVSRALFFLCILPVRVLLKRRTFDGFSAAFYIYAIDLLVRLLGVVCERRTFGSVTTETVGTVYFPMK